MTEWTDLDEAYLEIFGEHPELEVRHDTSAMKAPHRGPSPNLVVIAPIAERG
jgi:hypothetical protein